MKNILNDGMIIGGIKFPPKHKLDKECENFI